MPRIRLKHDWARAGKKLVRGGDVVEVDQETFEAMLDCGAAIDADKVEAATAQAPEQAARTLRPKPRTRHDPPEEFRGEGGTLFETLEARDTAVAAGLRHRDFEGRAPDSPTGFTLAQVQATIHPPKTGKTAFTAEPGGIPFETAAALTASQAAGLTPESFTGRTPDGEVGFTLAFVEAAIAKKAAKDPDGKTRKGAGSAG